MSTGTAHSAEYIAVDALATVINTLAMPRYIIDPRGGNPRDFERDFRAAAVHSPNDNVRVVEGMVSKDALNAAVLALSDFVSSAAMRRDES